MTIAVKVLTARGDRCIALIVDIRQSVLAIIIILKQAVIRQVVVAASSSKHVGTNLIPGFIYLRIKFPANPADVYTLYSTFFVACRN